MWIVSKLATKDTKYIFISTCYFDLRLLSYDFVWAFNQSFGCFLTTHKTCRLFTWLVTEPMALNVSSVPSHCPLWLPCSPHCHIYSCLMNDYINHCHQNMPMKREYCLSSNFCNWIMGTGTETGSSDQGRTLVHWMSFFSCNSNYLILTYIVNTFSTTTSSPWTPMNAVSHYKTPRSIELMHS